MIYMQSARREAVKCDGVEGGSEREREREGTMKVPVRVEQYRAKTRY